MNTPARPATQQQPQPQGLFERLLRELPDEIIFDTRQLTPGQSNLELAAASFANFGLKAPTQADLDAEARRRTARNRDPQADPSPGDSVAVKPKFGAKGAAQAAKRFGGKS